jgi:hypothetical protein
VDESGESRRRASYSGGRAALAGHRQPLSFAPSLGPWQQRSFLQSHPRTSRPTAHHARAACYTRPSSSVSSHPKSTTPCKHTYMMINYWSYPIFSETEDTTLLLYTQTPETTPPSLYTNHASAIKTIRTNASQYSIRTCHIDTAVRKILHTRVSSRAKRLPDQRLSDSTTSSFLLHTTTHNHVCRSAETTGACAICTPATTSTSPSSRGSTRLICPELGWPE